MSSLKSFYDNVYKNKLNDYYIDFLGKRFMYIIKLGIIYLLISLVPSVSFCNFVSFKYKYVLCFFYNFFVIMAYIFKIKRFTKNLYYMMNDNVISDLFAFINDNKGYIYKNNYQIKENLFKAMDIFNFDSLNYSGSNLIDVAYKNGSILASDVNLFIYNTNEFKEFVTIDSKKYLKRTIRNDAKSIFKGFYIELNMTKFNNCNIYLVPNNVNDKVFNKYIRHYGEKVVLEDINFNKRYCVFANDQVAARYILSIDLMDRINQMDYLIPNKKYIVFKNDSTVGIFISDFSFEDLRKTVVPIRRNDVIEMNYLNAIYSKINNFISIYDILNLDNDLYDLR